ncbi:hypothetical protein ACLOJK_036759 [Asimina triloba]
MRTADVGRKSDDHRKIDGRDRAWLVRAAADLSSVERQQWQMRDRRMVFASAVEDGWGIGLDFSDLDVAIVMVFFVELKGDRFFLSIVASEIDA